MATTTRRSRRNQGKKAMQVKTTARIRIPNTMVEEILHTPPEQPTMDMLQAQLMRLNEASASQADRILVTHNEDSLDLLRDWCTRLIADNRLSDEPHAKQLVAEASRVIGFMDHHETKSHRATQHANGDERAAG